MAQAELTGLVRKCVGGFYTVEYGDELLTCKARGKFRREGISPCAGDRVLVAREPDGTATLTQVLPRKNHLVRPPLANLDQLIVVASAVSPSPDPLAIDKTVAAAEMSGIAPVVVLTKTDLGDLEELRAAYALAGIPCFTVSSVTGEGVEPLRELLWGRTSAFTGNSGVGKSSLLNLLFPEFALKTGETSRKLGRGRHTTREVELFPIGQGGYVADTPGFSSFDLQRYSLTDPEQLAFGFREFVPYLGKCQFSTCAHTKEKGCAVVAAVRAGEIDPRRHGSYCAMLEEIRRIKQWER